MIPFLDSNVLLRHLRQDHPVMSPTATAILTRIEQRRLQARTSDLVVFETVFTLQRGYGQPKEKIAEAVLPLIQLPGILLPGKRRYRKIFELYQSGPLGFADCYHVVLMQQLGINEILSFGRHFDRVPGIKRRES